MERVAGAAGATALTCGVGIAGVSFYALSPGTALCQEGLFITEFIKAV